MERKTSVLRNKTVLGFQFFMTKYEPHSCSKIVMAVEAISLTLIVSNLGFSDGLQGKELMVTKPYEPIKANESLFERMSGMRPISWVFSAEEARVDKRRLQINPPRRTTLWKNVLHVHSRSERAREYWFIH